MSKKDKAVGAEAHMNSVARVFDGWIYEITLQSGATMELWDRDYLDSVLARWNSTEPNALIHFSGAKADAEGLTVGAGAVRASFVVAISEASPDEEDEDEEDERGDGEEGDEDLEDEAREQFRPMGTGAPDVATTAPTPTPAAPVVTDAELD